MGLRHRSIRTRVAILIVVPVLCLIGLYAFAASITLGNALTQSHTKAIKNSLGQPLSNFQIQLDLERHLALQNLANPTNTGLESELGIQEAATDRSLGQLKLALASPAVTDNASSYERRAIANLLVEAKKLTYIRGDVSAHAFSLPTALIAYNSIVNAAYTVLDHAIVEQSSVPLVTQALNVISMGRVAQTAVAEADLLSADMAQGKFPEPDRLLFAQLVGQRRTMLATVQPELRQPYSQMVSASLTRPVSDSLNTLENAVITTPWRKGPPPAQLIRAMPAFQKYSIALNTALKQAGNDLSAQAQNNASSVLIRLILAAGLGLLGTIASIVLSLVIGRGLVRQLRELRQSALELAHDKLPTVISQLRAGQQVDVSEYQPPTPAPSQNEVEQVEQAFGLVQQAAVQSAIDEARLRRGISDVFRNLAGRSQSLLHRQLTLLDGMERRASEPEELEDLFRIDHLTTRMRRHAEGLIILSGETPARGWRQPVPLIDVLRAAVAEVEDYTRIQVLARTGAAIAGHAVADVIHMVAELAENATVFSPPTTPVLLSGEAVGRGLAIEIEDRGLGISPERMAEINANLESPPQFDLSGSDRLGLFIAGLLAQRHDIKITLRPSVYGGTTAIVLIPTALVVDEDAFSRDPALPAGRPTELEAGRGFGRHAALGQPDSRARPDGVALDGVALDGIALDGVAADGLTPDTLTDPDVVLTQGSLTGPAGAKPADTVPADPTRPGSRVAPAHDESSGRVFVNFDRDYSGNGGQELPGNGFTFGSRAASSAPEETDAHDPELTEAFYTAAEETDTHSSPGNLTDHGLPIRVRQANLAPQLRRSPPTATTGPASTLPASTLPASTLPVRSSTYKQSPAGTPPAAGDRGWDHLSAPRAEPSEPVSPEAARSTMSALQRGWQLGRSESADLPAEPASTDNSDEQGSE